MFAFVFAFAMLSFIQRTSIAVAGQSIVAAVHITQLQVGLLSAAFLATYTLMQVPSGALGERYGARRAYIVVGVLGVLATLATPLLPIVFKGTALFAALLTMQCVLGASQAPVFPMSSAIIEAWFPVHQWAVTNGFQTAGMLLGGAVTPLLIVAFTEVIGWQGALLVITLPVILVYAAWSWYGRDTPEEHPSVTPEEMREIRGKEVRGPQTRLTKSRLVAILGDRNIATLAASYLLMNYAFYFLTFWSFLYLVQVRHFSGITSGIAGMLPWLGAAIGAAIGGIASDGAVKRLGHHWGYRLVPLISLPLVAAILLMTTSVATPWLAVATLGAAFAAIEVNEGAYWAATMSAARTDTGAATAVLNTGGNAGGIVCQFVVGILTSAGDWEMAFATGAVMAVGAALLWLCVGTAPATDSPPFPVARLD